MKKITLSEYEEAVLLVEYLDLLVAQKKIQRYTHVNNETYTTSWNQKRRNKRIGGYKGFPDYIILTLINGLVFIELKREKGGKVSKEQQEWIDSLIESGYDAYVAHGFEEAKDIVDRYF